MGVTTQTDRRGMIGIADCASALTFTVLHWLGYTVSLSADIYCATLARLYRKPQVLTFTVLHWLGYTVILGADIYCATLARLYRKPQC